MQLQGRATGYLPASAFTRTNRIVIGDQGYFFKSRESQVNGPFPTEAKARFELNLFIEIKRIEQEFASAESSNVA
ncbi:MAG: DUF6316 family protein [Kangiellaceae bacterium]|jgi:hypothetical protein